MLTYMTSAFAIAAAAYAMISFPVGHLPREKRENFSLWLLGAYKDNWVGQFCAVFDNVFGEKHVSLKCFLRSSMASIFSVVLLYLLFSESLGIFDKRSGRQLSFYHAMAIGALINIIPDYISLLETRWILQKMRSRNNPVFRLFLIVVDFVFTFVIIFLAIQAYLLLRGETPVSFPEVMGAFSVYSIFFYSTFITSLWSIAYGFSSGLVKAFERLKLSNYLDVEERPGASVGLVCAIFVFGGVLAVKPIFTPDKLDRTVFDRGLCKLFPSSICEHTARAASSPEARMRYFRNACFSEKSATCSNATLNENYAALCDVGNSWACAWLGVAYRDGTNGEANPELASEFFNKSCDLNFGWACYYLGYAHINELSLRVVPSPSEAFRLLKKACELNNAEGCALLGVAYRDGTNGKRDLLSAFDAYERSCDLGYDWACDANPLQTPQDGTSIFDY